MDPIDYILKHLNLDEEPEQREQWLIKLPFHKRALLVSRRMSSNIRYSLKPIDFEGLPNKTFVMQGDHKRLLEALDLRRIRRSFLLPAVDKPQLYLEFKNERWSYGQQPFKGSPQSELLLYLLCCGPMSEEALIREVYKKRAERRDILAVRVAISKLRKDIIASNWDFGKFPVSRLTKGKYSLNIASGYVRISSKITGR